MADFKYTVNGHDLNDVYGLANDDRPRYYVRQATQPQIPRFKSSSSINISGVSGEVLNGRPLYEPSYVNISIVATSFGTRGAEDEFDYYKNFRENKDFIRSLFYDSEFPTLRYFPALPTNVLIPEDINNSKYGYFFYYDAEVVVVNSRWTEISSTEAQLDVTLKIPAGFLGSRWVNLGEVGSKGNLDYDDWFTEGWVENILPNNISIDDFIVRGYTNKNCDFKVTVWAENDMIGGPSGSIDEEKTTVLINKSLDSNAPEASEMHWLPNEGVGDSSDNSIGNYIYESTDPNSRYDISKSGAYNLNQWKRAMAHATPGMRYDSVIKHNLRLTKNSGRIRWRIEALTDEGSPILPSSDSFNSSDATIEDTGSGVDIYVRARTV